MIPGLDVHSFPFYFFPSFFGFCRDMRGQLLYRRCTRSNNPVGQSAPAIRPLSLQLKPTYNSATTTTKKMKIINGTPTNILERRKKNIIKNKPRLSLLLFQLWRWNFYPTGRPFLFDVIQKYRQTTKRLLGIFFLLLLPAMGINKKTKKKKREKEENKTER